LSLGGKGEKIPVIIQSTRWKGEKSYGKRKYLSPERGNVSKDSSAPPIIAEDYREKKETSIEKTHQQVTVGRSIDQTFTTQFQSGEE